MQEFANHQKSEPHDDRAGGADDVRGLLLQEARAEEREGFAWWVGAAR